MQVSKDEVEHYTPPVETLLPNRVVKCSEVNCNATFTNQGHYELHLLKFHNITPAKRNSTCLYYCPSQQCPYNIKADNCKYFKELKYLRQHYQKVHAQKLYICVSCKKDFITERKLKSHTEICGKSFICAECGWNYNSIEALLTHTRRKGHKFKENAKAKKKSSKTLKKPGLKMPPLISISRATTPVTQPQPTAVATAPTQSPKKHTQTTVDILPTIVPKMENSSLSDQQQDVPQIHKTVDTVDNNCTNIILNSIGTQVEPNAQMIVNWLGKLNQHTKSMQLEKLDNKTTTFPTSIACDDIFITTETQTSSPSCISDLDNALYIVTDESNQGETKVSNEDFISTETQTSFTEWCSELQNHNNWLARGITNDTSTDIVYNDLLVSTATQTCSDDQSDWTQSNRTNETNRNNNICDEMFISTETQTSFTQYLPDMHMPTGWLMDKEQYNSTGINTEEVYDNSKCLLKQNKEEVFGTDQYTQTCDMLLEGLFGGRASDIMINFQSTYTQT